MKLSDTQQALLLATFFRGNRKDQEHWTARDDQIWTLSLFDTNDLIAEECQD